MLTKETHFQIKGISQDLAYLLFNPEYAFEMKNIRINTTDENSLLSLTNELGTSSLGAVITKNSAPVDVKVLGWGQFSDYCILFSKGLEEVEPEHVDTYTRIYSEVASSTLPTENVGGETKKILTAEINGTYNVTVLETSIKALQLVSTGLLDTNVGSVSYTDAPMIVDADTFGAVGITLNELFMYCSNINCLTISDYYAAFKFTSEVMNLIIGLVTPVNPAGNDYWMLQFNNWYIGGHTPSYMGTSNLQDKYLVYKYDTKTWCFTDDLSKISVEVTRQYAPASILDYISVVKSDGTTKLLYEGNLNFKLDKSVRTICVYENEDVQKIYWIDGENVPRVANVAPNTWDDNTKNISFQKLDFIPSLNYGETVDIVRTSGGRFPAGVILYVLTYSDKNLQETNIFYSSPLYYSTESNKGAYAESVCNIAFDITVNNADIRFDYIQAYVVIRTSIDAAPAVYRIADIPYDKTTVKFTDNGTQWEAYSPDELLLKQLNTFIPKIIASKDSTLFLGNYTLESPFADKDELSDFLTTLSANTLMNYVDANVLSSDYSFNLVNGSKAITTFRNGEWYRLGVQFEDDRGTPTNILYLKDITSSMSIDPSSPEFRRKIITSALKSVPSNTKLKRIRLMMVDRSRLPRRTICQGILCPTVYKINDRVNNLPFAMSSWNMRGFLTNAFINQKADGTGSEIPTEAGTQWMTDMPLLPNLTLYGGEISNQDNTSVGVEISAGSASDSSATLDTEDVSGVVTYYLARVRLNNKIYGGIANNYEIVYRLNKTTDNSVVRAQHADHLNTDEYKQHSFYLYSIEEWCVSHGYEAYTNAGLKNYLMDLFLQKLQTEGAHNPAVIVSNLFADWRNTDFRNMSALYLGTTLLGDYKDTAGNYYDAKTSDYATNTFEDAVQVAVNRPYFFCDHNILTFHSPDVEANQTLIDNNANIKYRVVGYTLMDKTNFANYLLMDRGASTNDNNSGTLLVKRNSQTGMANVPLWKDGDTYMTYIWHRSVSLGSQNEPDDKGRTYGSYKRKVFSNLHFCGASYAMTDGSTVYDVKPQEDGATIFPPMGTPRVFNSNEVSALTVERQPNSSCIHNKLIYYGNVNIAHTGTSYYITKMAADGSKIENSVFTSTDPCIIRYKSTPHVVMPMSFIKSGDDYYAPTLPIPAPRNTRLDKWRQPDYNTKKHGYLWGSLVHGFWRGTWPVSDQVSDWDGLLYIAELYLDLSVNQIYGDTSEENLAKYQWVPISDWVDIKLNNYMEGYGDTFIGRWDCLKTYSFSEDDSLSYVDITSFIVESDINLESRCDLYKGILDATMVNPTNFNQFNPVYNLSNNFFRYNYLKQSELLNNFQNQVCWSEVKVLGEELDTWTQINVGNNTDFQGEYGQLRAAANLGNNLYFLQDDALYKLNYNTRVAISPTDGVPIQISNNYSVDPPLLIKQYCGTTSQDKLITSPTLMYFHDPNRNRIFAMSPDDLVTDLSSDKGINSILNKYKDVKKVYYDSIVKDIYFNFESSSLAFNEDLMEFTSLYDYNGISSLFALEGSAFTTYGANIYKQRTGKYNYFFGKPKSFYVELLANQEPLVDKTFSNIEYTLVGSNDAEMSEAKDEQGHLKPLDSFDLLETKTSYQTGSLNLKALRVKPSNLKRKFRIWRTDLPRATGSMDRMRDLWMKVKLTKNTENSNRYRLNNINVTYSVI